MTAGFTLLRFDHIQVAAPSGCESAAREFYGTVLQMLEIPKPEELEKRGGAWFRSGEVEIHVGVQKDFVPAIKAHPGIVVTGLDALRERLEQAGYIAPVDTDRTGFRRIHVSDPFGNRLEFAELI